MSPVPRLDALRGVSTFYQGTKTSPSSSLVTTPVSVDNPRLLLLRVFVEDKGDDDDFACPLVHVLQPTGLAAQVDVCTGKRGRSMQGQSQCQPTTDKTYWRVDKAIERLYKRRKRSGDKVDEIINGKKRLTELAGQDKSNRGCTAMRSPAGLIPKDGTGLPYCTSCRV
jgi:hypothetical protein